MGVIENVGGIVKIRVGDMMVNTKIEYMYRDASNYKAYPERDVIVEGELVEQDVRVHLREVGKFIPHDIGLPELQSQLESYPSADDHIWHEFIGLESTGDSPTVEVTAEEIKVRLEEINENGWNESKAFERHGFMKRNIG